MYPARPTGLSAYRLIKDPWPTGPVSVSAHEPTGRPDWPYTRRRRGRRDLHRDSVSTNWSAPLPPRTGKTRIIQGRTSEDGKSGPPTALTPPIRRVGRADRQRRGEGDNKEKTSECTKFNLERETPGLPSARPRPTLPVRRNVLALRPSRARPTGPPRTAGNKRGKGP